MLELFRSESNASAQDNDDYFEARQQLQPSGTTPAEKWLWERVIEMRTMRAGGVSISKTGKLPTPRLGTLGSCQVYKTKLEVLAALGRDTGPISSRF